ncbi:MAG TPA: sodium/proton-translocating pyrophosphatase, partial [Desulfobacteria bacterium]|nr:sodium/proton-translocating pyrophosphatase [Desulfobacteria bacterium]
MTDTVVARFTALARKLFPAMAALVLVLLATAANASEAELIIPDLAKQNFLGMNGHNLLLGGLVICLLGIAFSLVQFSQIRNLPVHKSMLEISELIWETCKTYLIQQGKFLAILWVFIAAIMVWYFSREMNAFKIGVIVVFSIVGILGSYSVAWFGIRMN